METEINKIIDERIIDNDLESIKRQEEDKIVEKVKGMRNFLYSLKDKKLEIHEKIADIGHELEKCYPDLRRTYLFHIMSFSGINREECIHFDLKDEDSDPDKDSIVKRLEALVKEYQVEVK